ncbi:hypothetical protein AMECASPLE_030212, partial [Ameca splendens]
FAQGGGLRCLDLPGRARAHTHTHTHTHRERERASQDAVQPYKSFLQGRNLIRQLIDTHKKKLLTATRHVWTDSDHPGRQRVRQLQGGVPVRRGLEHELQQRGHHGVDPGAGGGKVRP